MGSYRRIFQKRFSLSAKDGISSKIVRNRFIEFFQEHEHKFVRSSSVVPRNDKTIPFVNAGMCQFKHLLSGNIESPFERIVNSQKCIRVSGKHNDLNEVGLDGHHHTFFEMLGNWSFNNYFKETACKLAWELLTTPPFSLDKRKLYVTYFSGEPSLSLPPDIETYDIWRKIGVPEDQIFPAGLADNFWEMSRVGPCGPCTEILYNRSEQSQKILSPSQLTELWNIVFIQYNREDDGSLKHLPASHVDTGMGLERILAVLLNKTSNYDTDLFIPLFETIHKVTGVRMYKGKFGEEDSDGLDTIYRKLADYCRMITVATADGVFPDINPKLRRILRKVLTLPEKHFGFNSGKILVVELAKCVTESLGTAYPEIQNNFNQIEALINFEAEILESARKSTSKEWNRLLALHPELSTVDVQSMIGIVVAYNDTKKQIDKRKVTKGSYLPADLVVRLFTTFGLDLEAVQDLGNVLDFKIDLNEFDEEYGELKDLSKKYTLTLLDKSKLLSDDVYHTIRQLYPKTEDSSKYDYQRNELGNSSYVFHQLSSKLLAVIKKNEIIFSQTNESSNRIRNGDEVFRLNRKLDQLSLNNGDSLSFIFDKTCFYSQAGGQESDRGHFFIESFDKRRAKVVVESVENFNGYIVHQGKVELDAEQDHEFAIKSPCPVTLILDESHRLRNMQNHTTVHILHAILCQSHPIVAQRASNVNSNSFRFDFNLYGSKLEITDTVSIEEKVKQVIQSSLPVKREVISGHQIFSQNVKLLPGEVYPYENVSTIEIRSNNFFSKEACCGTHVLNTKDIEDFIITGFKTRSRICSISGVTGEEANTARSNANRVILKMKNFKEITKQDPQKSSIINQVTKYQALLDDFESEVENKLFPVNVSTELQEFIELYPKKKLRSLSKALCVEEVVEEIKDFIDQKGDHKFTVHFLSRRRALDKTTLAEVIDVLALDQPIFVCGHTNYSIIALCKVPQNLISEDFNAKKWMDAAVEFLDQYPRKRESKEPLLQDRDSDEMYYFELETSLNRRDMANLLAQSATIKAEAVFNQQ